jgi:hypothetical protein
MSGCSYAVQYRFVMSTNAISLHDSNRGNYLQTAAKWRPTVRNAKSLNGITVTTAIHCLTLDTKSGGYGMWKRQAHGRDEADDPVLLWQKGLVQLLIPLLKTANSINSGECRVIFHCSLGLFWLTVTLGRPPLWSNDRRFVREVSANFCG